MAASPQLPTDYFRRPLDSSEPPEKLPPESYRIQGEVRLEMPTEERQLAGKSKGTRKKTATTCSYEQQAATTGSAPSFPQMSEEEQYKREEADEFCRKTLKPLALDLMVLLIIEFIFILALIGSSIRLSIVYVDWSNASTYYLLGAAAAILIALCFEIPRLFSDLDNLKSAEQWTFSTKLVILLFLLHAGKQALFCYGIFIILGNTEGVGLLMFMFTHHYIFTILQCVGVLWINKLHKYYRGCCE